TSVKQVFYTSVGMKLSRPLILIAVVALALAAGAYGYAFFRPTTLTLTGIVTTNDVIVSPQVAGQVVQLLVNEGDPAKQGQLLATSAPDELKADTVYYAQNVEGLQSQVRQSEAALRFEERQTSDQTAQAESNLAAAEAQAKAAAADLEAANATYART